MVKIQPSVNPDIKNKTFKNVKKNGKVQKKKNESSSEKNILVEEMVEKTTKKLNKKFKAKNIKALSEDDTSNVEDRSSQDECDQLESDSEDLQEETNQIVEVTGNNTSLDVQGKIGNDEEANKVANLKIDEDKKLSLDHLSCNTSVSDIIAMFPKYKIKTVTITNQRPNSDLYAQNCEDVMRPFLTAFITFTSTDEAKKALQINGMELNGRKLNAWRGSQTKGIYIKNIPFSWELEQVNKFFSSAGEINYCRMYENKTNNEVKNCYISFENFESEAAAFKLNGTKLNNHEIAITKFQRKPVYEHIKKPKVVKKQLPFNKPSFRGPPFNKPSFRGPPFNNRNHFMKPPNSSLNEVNLQENMMKQIENNILKKIASHLAK